jgi:hypothetical protein
LFCTLFKGSRVSDNDVVESLPVDNELLLCGPPLSSAILRMTADFGVAVFSLSSFLLHFFSSFSIHRLVSWLSESTGADLNVKACSCSS